MNYLPFCGYWFYGGTSVQQTAAFYSSWGLLAVVPVAAASAIVIFMNYYRRLRT
jgi:hypothetical protein